jgi:membrane protein implicated in regulation of membrane protease activity
MGFVRCTPSWADRFSLRQTRRMALVVAVLLALFVVDGAWEYAVVATGGAVEIGEAWFWWWFTHRRPSVVGAEALLGRVVEIDDDGWARVAGERWQVRGARAGERARVVSVDGLTLVVEKIPA